jgi:hypothetical protein
MGVGSLNFAETRGKQNYAAAVPGSSPFNPCVAQHLNWTAIRRNDLQLSVREESDPPAIGRPEGLPCAFRARKRLEFGTIQGAHP